MRHVPEHIPVEVFTPLQHVPSASLPNSFTNVSNLNSNIPDDSTYVKKRKKHLFLFIFSSKLSRIYITFIYQCLINVYLRLFNSV